MAKPRVYTLNENEIKILQRGMEDPDYITGYFFKASGDEAGWYFDNNFTERGKWQKTLHHAAQPLIVTIGGVGTGKSLGVGMSASVWCLTTEDFKFMNVAQKGWQARIMYDLIMERSVDTPFEKLIWSAPQMPYPKIILKFRIGSRTYQSTLEFMSVDKNALGIFSWRGDWINIEEAGLIDNLDEVVMNLATRLTGSSRRGRAYVGRMSLISNPWDTPHLWYLFDLASASPEKNLSLTLSTRDNLNVTKEQIDNMLKLIPEDERERFLEGVRPEGKGAYFSKESIYACENSAYAELIENAVADRTPGYVLAGMYGAGIVHMQTPRVQGRMYFILGDPGSSNAPLRNSPVVMVWDVTDFPSMPISLVGFWWGQGNDQITPFVTKLLEWRDYYNPAFIGVDSTGPQKSMAELINTQFLYPDDTKPVVGNIIESMDFSGARKSAYLVATRLILEARLATWPKNISGMRAQLSNYDPAKDRVNMPKIAQDIVATFSMVCFAVRTQFGISPMDFANSELLELSAENISIGSRQKRLTNDERSRRSESRVPIEAIAK